MKRLVIYGAGGNGEVAADIARLNGYEDIAFIDDNKSITKLKQYSVFHSINEIIDFDNRDFYNAIGNNSIREKISNKINKKQVTLIHPSSVIGENVEIGDGVLVAALAVINPGSKIGKGSIINTYSSIDHDCIIGNYVHISVGAHLAGTITIGDRTFVGIGANVINNVNISKDVMVGAGATVIEDLKESGTYVGVPARKIK